MSNRYTQATWTRYMDTAQNRLTAAQAGAEADKRAGHGHMTALKVGFWERRVAFLKTHRPQPEPTTYCPACGGEGFVTSGVCPACGGTGKNGPSSFQKDGKGGRPLGK